MDFSKLSNDLNPLHDTIYHGIHLVLLILENHIKNRPFIISPFKISKLHCQFLHPVYFDDEFEIQELTIVRNGTKCVDIKLDLVEVASFPKVSSVDNLMEHPLNGILEEYDMPLHIDTNRLSKMFPLCFQFISTMDLVKLINLSKFVGMISPGLYSIFSEFEYTHDSTLYFRLKEKTSVNCTYTFTGGWLTAYYRPKEIDYTCPAISSRQFQGEKVLVIGGSRGLGRVISMLFKAAGAEVTSTHYKSNQNNTIHYDVLTSNIDLTGYTRVFYMATPRIHSDKYFSSKLFDLYYSYFVTGFQRLEKEFSKVKYVYYPSSTAIGTEFYKEYALAKMVGEELVNSYRLKYPNITFDSPRLPRLKTDNTNSVVQIAADPFKYYMDYFKFSNIYILTGSTVDFVVKALKEDVTVSPFGQLYQTLLNPPVELLNAKHVFVLATIEDVLMKPYVFHYDQTYIEQIDHFMGLLKKLGREVFILPVFQRTQSPWDGTPLSITRVIDYYNKGASPFNFPFERFDLSLFIQGKYSFSMKFSEYLAMTIKSQIYTDKIKCVVLDLDNTLWQGVVGEGDAKVDERYEYFHHVLASFQKRGILLAISSKNDEHIATPMLEKLLLKNFVCKKINWQPKSKNIQEIAKELNLSLKNMLFVDDNPVEREDVKATGCQILDIKRVDPLHYAELLLNHPMLYTTSVTTSDLEKTQQYETKNKIEEERNKFSTLDEFLQSLQTVVTFSPLNNTSFDRAYQLVHKTNQFNLNKRSYTKEEFLSFSVVVLEYTDKFTHNDQVGVIMYKNEDVITIENIVLSCRVFNRKFEDCIFTYLKKLGKPLQGKYVQTDANKKFSGIFQDFGFDSKLYFSGEAGVYPSCIQVVERGDKDVPNMYKEILNIFDIKKDIVNFKEIEDFGSLKMMYLIGRLKPIFPDRDFTVESFYDKKFNVLDIQTWCKLYA